MSSLKYPFSGVELSDTESTKVRIEFAQALTTSQNIVSNIARVLYVDSLCDHYAFKLSSLGGNMSLAAHQHEGVKIRDELRRDAYQSGAYGTAEPYIDAVREIVPRMEIEVRSKTKINEIKKSLTGDTE